MIKFKFSQFNYMLIMFTRISLKFMSDTIFILSTICFAAFIALFNHLWDWSLLYCLWSLLFTYHKWHSLFISTHGPSTCRFGHCILLSRYNTLSLQLPLWNCNIRRCIKWLLFVLLENLPAARVIHFNYYIIF